MSEIRKLRKAAGLTQEGAANRIGVNTTTFGAWERGDRTPDYKMMDKIRRVLGSSNDQGVASYPDHVRHVSVHHAGGGPGRTEDGDETLVLDTRLFAGSGIDFDNHILVRVQGSSMAEVISHGQIVFCEPVDKVEGQDIYVYWRGEDLGNVIAIMDTLPGGGLRIEKRGPSRTVTDWQHKKNDIYEAPDGRTSKINVWARVLGAFSRPADELAARQSAAISAATAMQTTR